MKGVDTILFLCTKEEIQREKRGYQKAFNLLGYKVIPTGIIKSLKEFFNCSTIRPEFVKCIIHPEPYTVIHPNDLHDYDIPTVVFQWDTYVRPKVRAISSVLYDIQVFCHPNFLKFFKKVGCFHPLLLPWCFDHTLLKSKNNQRNYDIGWVGQLKGRNYKLREKMLNSIIKEGFVTNDIGIKYTWAEMTEIYQQAKIVINISRDDFLQDANMRCFEAMGCGALLLTASPSELTQLGFKENVDFIGFTSINDALNKLRYFINEDTKREEIAKSAQKKVLYGHTYVARAETLLSIIEKIDWRENSARSMQQDLKKNYLAYTFLKDHDFTSSFQILQSLKSRPSLFVLRYLLISFIKKFIRLLISRN